MRKFAVLLAATLMVSVPLTMTVTTDVYAASKKAKKHKRAKAAPVAAPAEAGVQLRADVLARHEQLHDAGVAYEHAVVCDNDTHVTSTVVRAGTLWLTLSG